MSHHVMTGKNVSVSELSIFVADGILYSLLDFWKESLQEKVERLTLNLVHNPSLRPELKIIDRHECFSV